VEFGKVDRSPGPVPGLAEVRPAQPPALPTDEDQPVRSGIGKALLVVGELGHDVGRERDYSLTGMRAGLRQPPVSAMPVECLTPATEDRAVEVPTLLADQGQHRATPILDPLIAATAEFAGLTVLHCDKDFDLVAAVTGPPAERLRVA
jgi:predicted nucleic acid-binding protein